MPYPYTNTEILEFLKRNPIMTISASVNDKPLSSVVLYHVDTDFNYYFCTKDRSYKANALLKNPQISFSVWEHKKMLVQVDGIAEKIINNQDEVLKKIIDSTLNIDDFWPPVLHTEEDPYIFFKIIPHWMRIMDLSDSNISRKKPPYQLIINKYEKNSNH